MSAFGIWCAHHKRLEPVDYIAQGQQVVKDHDKATAGLPLGTRSIGSPALLLR